jgi:hypothetical protein
MEFTMVDLDVSFIYVSWNSCHVFMVGTLGFVLRMVH